MYRARARTGVCVIERGVGVDGWRFYCLGLNVEVRLGPPLLPDQTASSYNHPLPLHRHTVTQTLSYDFYFAREATYDHYPVHVSDGETCLAAAAPERLTVSRTPPPSDQVRSCVRERGCVREGVCARKG